ncbi:MAG: 4-hydroxythreonine-4-phosphate dehydrogenase PdxA [Proteobacteria bacterium]|nr:4-hydroxythreonine-4-phosphate dehydrogenase PdxA [Pseudomonadota bacterium]
MVKARIAVTVGDPAGIGPEIAIKAVLDPMVATCADLSIVANLQVLQTEAQRINRAEEFWMACRPGGPVHIVDCPLPHAPCSPGQISAEGGAASYDYVVTAARFAQQGKVDAIVTGPVHKESWRAAQVPHIGHTEAFAALFDSSAETLFVVDKLRIFFLTRHVSLAKAIPLMTPERLLALLRHAQVALGWLGISAPRIAVAALNPHAGDGGLFGEEETTQLLPGIEAARREGLIVFGPLPADSVFHQCAQGEFDAVISLYHDQGHIAAKMKSFFGTVSVTTGLPVVRTSVDHGTAFDIAGKNLADPTSMIEAIKLAAQIVRARAG